MPLAVYVLRNVSDNVLEPSCPYTSAPLLLPHYRNTLSGYMNSRLETIALLSYVTLVTPLLILNGMYTYSISLLNEDGYTRACFP